MFWMLLKSGGPGLLLFIRSLCKSIASETPVRVRFAPSPTGELHLGSLRTALFNYLFAKKYRGAFILRIENTDQTRLIADAEEKIEDTLSYFGLHLDESPLVGGNFGPYRQSERLLIYKDAAAKLLDSKHAYKCFCTQERLELLRKKALSEKSFPRYDLNCRKLSMSEINARELNGEVPVIRFKFDPGQMTFDDTVYGPYTHCWEETDFVIMKRDGYPTYHFASVVDDHLMQISNVIRGMEWLISTPKHLKLYESFAWDPPAYGHLPLITQDGKRKLSKRNNAAFVKYYIDMGYLPLAVLNFLLRNGSGIHNHDTHKLYSLEDMVYDFDERLMGKGTFMMHLRELDRYGRMAFQKANITSDILPVIKHQFSILSEEEKASLNPELLEEEYFRKVISFLKLSEETFSKLSDITTGDFHFFFMAPKTANKLLHHFPNIGRTLQMTKELIQLSRSGKMNFEELKMIATRESVPISDITKLIRLAVIDNISGPSIRELVDFFGREIENRLSHMMLLLENQSQREIKQL